MGAKARWRASMGYLLGQFCIIEGRLDLVLALSEARDATAVETLIGVFARLNVGHRADLLSTVRPTHYEAPSLTAAIKRLAVTRN